MAHSIKTQIVLSYFILVLVTIFVAGWAIYNFYQLDRSVTNILKKNYGNVISVEGMVESLERQNGAQLFLITKEVQQGMKRFSEYKNTFRQVNNNLRILLENDKNGKILLDSINLYYEFYIFGTDSLIKLVKQNKYEQAMPFYFNTIQPVFQVLRERCFALLEKNQEDMMVALTTINTNTNRSSYAVLFASIVAIILPIFIGVKFSNSITQPIENLTNLIQQIRGGKMDLKIETATEDEIGELIDEFKNMIERLQKYENLNIDRIIAEKRKSESIVESISDVIIVTDENNNIILINKPAENLFKIEEEKVLGKNFTKVIDDKKVFEMISKVAKNRGQFDSDVYADLVYENEEGKKYFRPILTSVLTESNDLLGVVTILQDITRFKELDRLKSDFMATVSHEFNTPLTSINMSIDILKQGILGTLNEKQINLLNSTTEDIMRLRKMVKELLELSRMQSKIVEIKKEKISINDCLEPIIKGLSLQYDNKGVELKIEVDKDIPEFQYNKDNLNTILTNLLNNALRYTNESGVVVLRAKKQDGTIIVSVSDNGRGISKENIGSIFDKFVQFKEEIDSTPGSVGLGLAISKEIIQNHNGNIWVESEVGLGTTFYFTIALET